MIAIGAGLAVAAGAEEFVRTQFGPSHKANGGLSVAATYLGVTEPKLQTELATGKTLAQAAKDHGKSVDGLVSAMVAAARKQIEEGAAAGRYTKQREQAIVSGLEQRFKAIVNGTSPSVGGPGGAAARGSFGSRTVAA